MTKQIGCEGKDVRFIPCSECIHSYDIQKCYEIRKEGNLEIIIKLKI